MRPVIPEDMQRLTASDLLDSNLSHRINVSTSSQVFAIISSRNSTLQRIHASLGSSIFPFSLTRSNSPFVDVRTPLSIRSAINLFCLMYSRTTQAFGSRNSEEHHSESWDPKACVVLEY